MGEEPLSVGMVPSLRAENRHNEKAKAKRGFGPFSLCIVSKHEAQGDNH